MVARIVEGRRPGDDGRALGLRLHPLPAVSRLILRGHLRKLPVMPAHREPPPELAEGEDQTRPTDYAQIVKDIWDGRR
jgi:hypothetical protein